jgi:hypothetical protein
VGVKERLAPCGFGLAYGWAHVEIPWRTAGLMCKAHGSWGRAPWQRLARCSYRAAPRMLPCPIGAAVPQGCCLAPPMPRCPKGRAGVAMRHRWGGAPWTPWTGPESAALVQCPWKVPPAPFPPSCRCQLPRRTRRSRFPSPAVRAPPSAHLHLHLHPYTSLARTRERMRFT